MKKAIFIGIGIIAMSAVALTFSPNNQAEKDLFLLNIEALASGEEGKEAHSCIDKFQPSKRIAGLYTCNPCHFVQYIEAQVDSKYSTCYQ